MSILQCSRKCGNGLKKRTVLCTSSQPGDKTHTLPDSLCAGLPKPGSQEPCFLKRCQKLRKVQWFVSTWQQVSSLERPHVAASKCVDEMKELSEGSIVTICLYFYHLQVLSNMRSRLSDTLHQVCREGTYYTLCV